jgi:hypothetical protein
MLGPGTRSEDAYPTPLPPGGKAGLVPAGAACPQCPIPSFFPGPAMPVLHLARLPPRRTFGTKHTLPADQNPVVITTDVVVPGPFPEPDLDLLKTHELDICFNGILRYIFLQSGRKWNTGELDFSFLTRCQKIDAHPSFVLDYETEERYGTGPSTANQYFAIKFRRMMILPCAYALRSDHYKEGTNRLRTFVFQARQDGRDWTTLDERVKIPSLTQPGSHFLAFVDTDEYFSEFRVLQTGPSHSNFLSFNLSGMEIHGLVERTCDDDGRVAN